MALENSSTVDSLTTIFPQIVGHVTKMYFSWYDYILFTVMLAVSALIGIYFGCFGTKQSSANEYLLGDKKMKVFPIAVSLVASHISGITLLAVPADIYRYGASYWLFVPAAAFVLICTLYIYLPVFYKLQITSTYEYLERRFDNKNRLLASFLFALGLFLYLPIVIYIPALAFSAATGVNIHYITPLVCGVCIFYTTLGGLKAVVWTDTIQFTVTVGAVLTIVGIGVKSAGGFGAVWSTAIKGHRLDIFDFDPDPTKRDSFWIALIGMWIMWLSGCIHQSCVQKFLSVPTFRDAKLAASWYLVGITTVASFSVFTGLIMYAHYEKCDPFTIGAVQKSDQLLPYYIMDVASHIPGLSGLFIAGIFCAALSTLSASLNCLAGTIFEDFVQKITGEFQKEKNKAFVLKLIVVVTGIFCTALVFVIEHLGSLLPLGISLGGVTNGPLVGMFTLGVLFPKASSKGTFYGSLMGLLCSGSIVTVAQYYKAHGILADIPKPISTEGCPALLNSTVAPFFFEANTTMTSLITNFTDTRTEMPAFVTTDDPSYQPFFLFRISHYYYAPLGTLVTIICGLVFSYLFTNDDPPVHRDLLSPIVHGLLPDKIILTEKPKDYYSLEKALHLVSINSEKGNNESIKA